jgi:hypothetical protein
VQHTVTAVAVFGVTEPVALGAPEGVQEPAVVTVMSLEMRATPAADLLHPPSDAIAVPPSAQPALEGGKDSPVPWSEQLAPLGDEQAHVPTSQVRPSWAAP